MKRSSPLWGSVSVLIGVVIAILALVRGAWLVPLLLLAFTAWGLWVVMFQLQPAWDSIRGYRKKEHDARKQREASLYSTAQANADAMQLLLRHVNHRISAYRHGKASHTERRSRHGIFCCYSTVSCSPPFRAAEQQHLYSTTSISLSRPVVMYAAEICPAAWDYAPADSDFIRRRRTQPNVFCVSSLNTGSTINDLLPKR